MKNFLQIFIGCVCGWIAFRGIHLPIEKLDRIIASQTFGSGDANWCYPFSPACSGSNSGSCNTNCEVAGQSCGVVTIYYSPEECRDDFGNQYCSNRQLTDYVVCSITVTCICKLRNGSLNCEQDIASKHYHFVKIYTGDGCSFTSQI
jgi:hypothetical protein